VVDATDLQDGAVMLRKGKQFHRIVLGGP